MIMIVFSHYVHDFFILLYQEISKKIRLKNHVESVKKNPCTCCKNHVQRVIFV